MYVCWYAIYRRDSITNPEWWNETWCFSTVLNTFMNSNTQAEWVVFAIKAVAAEQSQASQLSTKTHMMSFHSNICRKFNADTYVVPSPQATRTNRHEVALHHIPKSKHYVLSVVSMNENIFGAIFIHISNFSNLFSKKKCFSFKNVCIF